MQSHSFFSFGREERQSSSAASKDVEIEDSGEVRGDLESSAEAAGSSNDGSSEEHFEYEEEYEYDENLPDRWVLCCVSFHKAGGSGEDRLQSFLDEDSLGQKANTSVLVFT